MVRLSHTWVGKLGESWWMFMGGQRIIPYDIFELLTVGLEPHTFKVKTSP